jgi:hypothetical protein
MIGSMNDQAVDAGTASAPRRRRGGNRLRIVLVVALLATGIALAVVYRKMTRQRAALLRIQQTCLSYALPQDKVVYEENPARAAELLSGGAAAEYVRVDRTGPDTPAVAGHVPQAWREMLRWAMPKPAHEPPGAVLFLHERQTETGKRLLVCVEADRPGRRLRVTYIHPGGTTLDPTPLINVSVAPLPQPGLVFLTPGGDPFESKLPPADADPAARADFRIYAGQPDARDPMRFKLPYELKGRRGELEMWVQDDATVHYVDRMFAPS